MSDCARNICSLVKFFRATWNEFNAVGERSPIVLGAWFHSPDFGYHLMTCSYYKLRKLENVLRAES